MQIFFTAVAAPVRAAPATVCPLEREGANVAWWIAALTLFACNGKGRWAGEGKKREMQTLIICYNFMLQLCYICAEMWNICRFLLIFLKK